MPRINRARRCFAWTMLALAVSTLGGVYGCVDRELPTGRASNPRATAAPALGKVRAGEALFAELAAQAPSSAGFFLDQTGNLVVVLRDSVDAAAARAALSAFVGSGQIRNLTRRSANVTIQKGRYTFAELSLWRDLIFDSVFTRYQGMKTLDLDEAHNRINIGIRPQYALALRPTVEAALARLGIDSAAVTFSTVDAKLTFIPYNIRSYVDSLVGGMQISVARGACTLGFIASRFGQMGFVTASHCSQTFWGVDYSMAGQPSNGRRIGSELSDPPGHSCGFLGLNTCRATDASFYLLDDSIKSKLGLIARTQSNQGSVVLDQTNPYFIIRDVGYNTVWGAPINKLGITTGWTSGSINQTCVDYIEDANIVPPNSVNTCTYRSTAIADAGDSGGPVFEWYGGGPAVTLTGITFARDGDGHYFNAVMDIANELGSMTTQRGVNLATPALTGYLDGQNPVLTWPAVPGATAYDIFKSVERNTGTCTPTDGFVYLGTANAPWIDLSLTANRYYGTTNPGPKVPCYVIYYIYAHSAMDVSNDSEWIFFGMP